MGKYVIHGIDIRRDGKLHPEGSTIELDGAAVADLAEYLEPVSVEKEEGPAPKSSAEPDPATEPEAPANPEPAPDPEPEPETPTEPETKTKGNAPKKGAKK